MKRIKNFTKTMLLGGLGVILPVLIIILVFNGLFKFITTRLRPVTELVLQNYEIQGILADLLSLVIIILACFIIGMIVKTGIGKSIFRAIEKEVLQKIPGYNLVNDTIKHFTTAKEVPFSSVALVKPFGNETLFTAFITDRHPDKSYTVFIPTGPNPTSGNILHVKGKNVFPVDVSLEEGMKSVIGCGAGSKKIMRKYLAASKKKAST